MEFGQRVRVIGNPGRIGFFTGRSMERGGRLLLQIKFPDATQYYPDIELEIISEGKQHPLDLLADGKIGRSTDLRRLLTHVKLSGRLANLLYSMEVTNTDFYAYQFKPVLKILNSIGNGILIADEVGLGKTIEAGLIWTELKSRFDYRRLMVLCPAFLRVKWQRELKKRFGIKAEIMDAKGVYETLKAASKDGPSASFAIIGSMQGLRPQKGWDDDENDKKRPASQLASFLRNNQHGNPLVDLLIIDEAHYLRIPDLRHPDKKTSILGRLLRDVSDQVVLLSATPIQLRSHDLYQLLNIVDDATFNQPRVFDDILNANAPLLEAREAVIRKVLTIEEFKTLIQTALEHPLLQGNRQLTSLLEELPDSEKLSDVRYRSELAYKLDSINLLGHVITRTRKRDVTEWRVLREVVPEMISLTADEEQFYHAVTETVREFCLLYNQNEGFILTTPQRQMASSMPAALREWQRRAEISSEQLYEDYGITIDIEEMERGPVITELISRVKELGDLETLWNSDSKYMRLKSALQSYLKKDPQEKIVLFAYFRATLSYLHERLASDGIGSIILMGGIEQSKDEVIDDFSKPDGPSVLLSSEVGSEGIDLQFARVLINYDLPWNPMKVEQRIGRIDRLGQKAEKILIWNLFYENTIDSRIYKRLLSRLGIFSFALGGLEPILGQEIQKLTLDILLGKLTPEQEEQRIEQTEQAIINIQKHEEELEQQAAHLVAYGDYILNQVKAARELHRWVSGKDIQVYITDYFRLCYTGCEFIQQNDEMVYDILLTNHAKQDLEEFIRNNRLDGRTAFLRNDPHPVRCLFENKISDIGQSRIEIINQSHPLVRFVSSQLNESEDQYYPAVSVILNRDKLMGKIKEGLYVFTIQQWSVTGLQEIEKLHYSAVDFELPENSLSEDNAELLITSAAIYAKDWLEGRNVVDLQKAVSLANNKCLHMADEKYADFIKDIQNQNEDRADLQGKTLELHLQNQLANLNEVRDKHIKAGRDSLVKATEGRIIVLENRFERKLLDINKKRKITSDKNEICVGLIKVVAED